MWLLLIQCIQRSSRGKSCFTRVVCFAVFLLSVLNSNCISFDETADNVAIVAVVIIGNAAWSVPPLLYLTGLGPANYKTIVDVARANGTVCTRFIAVLSSTLARRAIMLRVLPFQRLESARETGGPIPHLRTAFISCILGQLCFTNSGAGRGNVG